MVEENDNEIVIGQVVYAFTSAGMAKGFEDCLNTGTLATCKEDWQPTGIYPPAVLDAKNFSHAEHSPAKPYPGNSED